MLEIYMPTRPITLEIDRVDDDAASTTTRGAFVSPPITLTLIMRRHGKPPSATAPVDEAEAKKSEGAWFPITLGLGLVLMLWLAAWSAASTQSAGGQWISPSPHVEKAPATPRPSVKTKKMSSSLLPAGPEIPAPTPSIDRTTRVCCETSAGAVSIDVHVDWAPHGARRFLDMVNEGFFDTRVALFRCVEKFLCQTGIAGDPAAHRSWKARGPVPDDTQWLRGPKPMKRGFLSFAGSGPNSRTTEFFFAFRDLQLGGAPWEVPFATLVGDESFDTLDTFYVGYGDMPRFGGRAPNQGRIYTDGLDYLLPSFPDLDYIERCSVVAESTALEW